MVGNFNTHEAKKKKMSQGQMSVQHEGNNDLQVEVEKTETLMKKLQHVLLN